VGFVKLFDRDGEIHLYIMEVGPCIRAVFGFGFGVWVWVRRGSVIAPPSPFSHIPTHTDPPTPPKPQVSKAALPGSNAIIGGIVTRLQAAPASRHLSARPSLHHRVQVFRSHATTTTTAHAHTKATEAAAGATLPAMAALPFDDSPTVAAAAPLEAATAAAEQIFGAPNLRKAAAPPLLPPVTGSGYGPPEGEAGRHSSASFSSSASGSPLTPAPAPSKHPAAVAAVAPDEEWLQAALPLPLPLPLSEAEAAAAAEEEEEEGELLEGLLEELAEPPSSLPTAKAPALPFAVRSAEEAALWQDVLHFYMGEGEGEADEATAAPAARDVAVAVAAEGEGGEAEQPGFGWGR
jgi:hypothetical protein